MRAVSAALARICDGRRAISFGNSSNFLGTGAGPNIFRVKSGRIILPKIGEGVAHDVSDTRYRGSREKNNVASKGRIEIS